MSGAEIADRRRDAAAVPGADAVRHLAFPEESSRVMDLWIGAPRAGAAGPVVFDPLPGRAR
ncbi:hypothetical protein [Nocardia brasiliensis]|uniref:hypothetical protein n=1 Tax=Nocardia brasiliensis TaxID=37326 RepID=UPI002458874E|nr:hypothetical protein [Nocardia brasiliensis]MBF6543070.1 hypothetical protein [Nocardia brasiliensis]